jgi:AraC-like DNA-binding protein
MARTERRQQLAEPNAQAIQQPVVESLGFRGLADNSPLAALVEGIADWNIPDAEMARNVVVKVFPAPSFYLIVQYGAPMDSSFNFGGVSRPHKQYRSVATALHSGIITVRPNGPLGAVIVRLRPEAAARVLGERMQDFSGAKIGLGEIFRARDMARLEEMAAEARSSAERLSQVSRFLMEHLQPRQLDPIVSRAALLLRRGPSLRVRQLATELDVSERHLSRKFNAMFGMGPKQFARTARVEKALAARNRGLAWAEIAYRCGFADQAHMIKDFQSVVGYSPEDALRSPWIDQSR